MRILLMGGDGACEAPLIDALAGKGFTLSRAPRADTSAGTVAGEPPWDAVVLFAEAARWALPSAASIIAGDVTIDPVARRVERGGRRVALSPREFDLLACLARRRGANVDRPTLLAEIWGYRFDPGTNLVAVHVSRLRAKLARPLIETVAGGYRFAG